VIVGVDKTGIFTEVVKLEEVDSTNRYALETGRSGVIVAALGQSAGRGRRGRSWFSPPGENLYITYTLSPVREHYPIVAGVAARQALSGLVPGVEVLLKWPNDVVAAGRKLCGILCESSYGITAVGMGVNVNQKAWPDPLAPRAVSLSQLAGRDFDLDEVASRVTDSLSEWVERYGREGFEPVRVEFLVHGMLKGLEVRDDTGEPCTIVDLTLDGHLVVETRTGRRELVSEGISIGW